MTATVIFRACAPTQSWGAVGNASDQRPTATHPLQSAVTGVISAAMGLHRDDTDAIRAVGSARMAFRIDRQGIITSEYQTISNTISADGNPRGTVISRRGELQDACITIFCAWDDPHLARTAAGALRFPHWPLHLGRRCHLVGAFPDAALVDEPISDALMGSWPQCPVHPATGDTWSVVHDTTDPVNAEGVTLTGARATDFTSRNHTIAPVRQRRIPRLEPRGADTNTPSITVDGSGTVIVDDTEIA